VEDRRGREKKPFVTYHLNTGSTPHLIGANGKERGKKERATHEEGVRNGAVRGWRKFKN